MKNKECEVLCGMELAVHMKNKVTNEERIKKVRGVNSSNHDPVKDFYYGSDWVWTGTEPFKNVADDIEHIGRGYYREKGRKRFLL